MPGIIPDNAIVIRGGRNLADDIARAMGKHPEGVFGFSVVSALNVDLAELTETIPHQQIGITSVEAIRRDGGDVVRTSGRSIHHATVTGIAPDVASRLLTPTQAHPRLARKITGGQS